MKYLLLMLLLLSGCISNTNKIEITYEATRLDKMVECIKSGSTTRVQEQEFIIGERKLWHSLNYSVNGIPLPADIQSISTGTK